MPFIGEIVPLVVTTRSAAGVLEADTTVRITVTLPDGTTEGPFTPTATATGVYQYLYTTATAGRSTWDATTASHGGFPGDVLDVQPASPVGLLSLADARSSLNFGSGTVNDDELRGYIDAATAVIESIIGPVVPRTVSETHTGTSVLLRQWPVLSVTSLAPYWPSWGGTSYVTADVLLSPSGEVTLLSGASVSSNTYTVVYRAGRLQIPPAVSIAARIIVQHLWDTQRGGANLPLAADTGLPVGLGFAMPNRAAELLAPYRRPPSVA